MIEFFQSLKKDFEKALAQAKKFAEKNENQISEAEFETLTDSFKIEPDEMINLRAELEYVFVPLSSATAKILIAVSESGAKVLSM